MNKTYKVVIFKIVFIILISLMISLMLNNEVRADLSPGSIVSSQNSIEIPGEINDTLTNAEKLIKTLGTIIAVGTLMIIGIKYMMGSIEERANYKASMFPWIVGAILLFGATMIYEPMKSILQDSSTKMEDVTSLGNIILGWIQIIGTYIAVAGLMIIGIKYILGSMEERAQYKKSMLPWVIGLVILFSAVNITKIIANAVDSGSSSASSTETLITKTTNSTYAPTKDPR